MKMKKLREIRRRMLVIVLLLAAAAQTLCVSAETLAAATADLSNAGGRIEISSCQELKELAKLCGEDSFSRGKTVILQNDIDLGQQMLTIPSFSGIFDGQGYKITGLYVVDEVSFTGLFGWIEESGQVKNLTVEGTIVLKDEGQGIGGIAGYNAGVVSDCSFQGLILGEREVGGVTGINSRTGQLWNTSVSGVVQGTVFTGGIAGKNEGIIFDCSNEASVNTEYTDEKLSMGTLEEAIYRRWKSGQMEGQFSTTADTGGVAGFSNGIIRGCVNRGEVGYAHVGYNVGGIVGRQCGYMENNSNEGHIYGRKDVGGIVGQMTPDITVVYSQDTLGRIRQELNSLQGMLNRMLESAGEQGNQVSDRIRRISDSGKQAGDHAQWISDYIQKQGEEAAENINDQIAIINGYSRRLQPVLEQLNRARDKAREGMEGLQEMGDETAEIADQMDVLLSELDGEMSSLGEMLEAGDASEEELTTSVDQIRDILDEMNRLREQLAKMVAEEKGKEELEAAFEMFDDAFTQLNQWVSDLSKEQIVSIPLVDAEFSEQSSGLSSSLENMSDQLSALNDELQSAGDSMTADLRQINDQFMEIMNLFLDALDEVQSLDYEELYEDVSEAELLEMVRGKVYACENHGIVEADVNAGGVAGAMAIEDSEDPEDDDKDTEHKSYRYTYQTKAILLDCTNTGEVIAGKNCAGGVTGRMDLGIIYRGQNCGSVSSVSGDYVGGVCGYALSTIRSSYAKCRLEGRKYVGGIAGSGDTVSDCGAMVVIEDYLQHGGAVAGEILNAASGNFFVSDTLEGVDGVSYEGKASRIPYEEMLTREGLPELFSQLTLTFRTDDTSAEEDMGTTVEQELKNYEYHIRDIRSVSYGQELGTENYPEVECPTGYYLEWDRDLQGQVFEDTVITGTFVRYNTVLASEFRRSDGLPAILMEGMFTRKSELNAWQRQMETTWEELRRDSGSWKYVFFNGEVTEQWYVSCPTDGQKERTMRFHFQEEEGEPLIFVREKGGWHQADAIKSGSHLLVQVEGNEVEFAVVNVHLSPLVWAGLAGAGLTGAAVVFAVRRKRKGAK